MDWSDVRTTYPDQWLVIEALQAHTEGNQRILERIAVVEVCPDSVTAMQTYRRLHQVLLDRTTPQCTIKLPQIRWIW